MKIQTALVAVALLGCGAAFAATPAAQSAAPAAPAAQSAAPAAPSATPVAKHHSLKACNKEATEKKLTGKERSAFVKDCRAGKASS